VQTQNHWNYIHYAATELLLLLSSSYALPY
jgi:hypothetical protein